MLIHLSSKVGTPGHSAEQGGRGLAGWRPVLRKKRGTFFWESGWAALSVFEVCKFSSSQGECSLFINSKYYVVNSQLYNLVHT